MLRLAWASGYVAAMSITMLISAKITTGPLSIGVGCDTLLDGCEADYHRAYQQCDAVVCGREDLGAFPPKRSDS